ncbi:MAG: OsmC family peroxiredoxin [Chloroflexi bacterium]|nr:MAG: OsmC family peroxiredoxin [Chloroflexota bacterium]MBL1194922.1 OsmC family peroxiredoxin [Chloroflexota bacterium]NOH12213.1 OsmC family protein [Chloroflexota bacterium]
MGATVTWKEGMSFTGTAPSGYSIDLGASKSVGGAEDGFRPMELMALSLAGCTGMDVISILQKKRQQVTDFEVRVDTKSADQHPHVWVDVEVEYIVTGHDIDPTAVERAMQLSSERYCPAQNMINKAVDIKLKYKIIEAASA